MCEAGGSSSQSAAMTACQMAAGQLGCRAISIIIITRTAQRGQKVKGRSLQICQAETPGNHQIFVSLSACVTFIYFM